MQISICEFCVDFQFHFLILFHIDFLLVKLIHTLVVHVCIGISLRQVVIDMLFVARVPMSSHVHPSELYFEVFFGMLDWTVNRCHTRLASSHEPIGKKWTHQCGKMPSSFESFWWFNRQHFVLGYFAQARLQSLSLHQNAWKVGWDRHIVLYYVHVSSGTVSRWVATGELNQMCFCFELLRGCCYGATSVPTSVRNIKETAVAPCRTIWIIWRLERRELETGHFMPWFPSLLSKLIAVDIMFFLPIVVTAGSRPGGCICLLCSHCFGQVFLGDLKPLKHQGTNKTLNENPPVQVCPQNITFVFKWFVWFALNECIVRAERMITTFDCRPD